MDKFRRFVSYYKPHIRLLLLDLFCAFTVSGIDLAYPLLSQYMLRTLLPDISKDPALMPEFVLL